MSTVAHFSNFSSGYVVELVANGTEPCKSWLLLPAENLWPVWLRAILYIAAMLYIFLGIAAASDAFMSAIEKITSTKKSVTFYDVELGQTVTKDVYVWNETVANLTLMALGSSAPEILLAIIETVSNLHLIDSNMKGSSLGLFTIIGSAAFNLLVITGICVISVASPGFKYIKEFGVFCITSVFSLWAYVWMLLCAAVITPHTIDLWEALLTLAFFPILVILAYCQDKGWWCRLCGGSGCGAGGGSVEEGKGNSVSPMANGNGQALDMNANTNHPSTSSASTTQLHTGGGSTYSVREIDASNSQMQRVLSRARLRHAAVKSMLGSSKRVRSATVKRPVLRNAVVKIPHRTATDNWGKVTFSSPNYSVLESGGHIEVDLILYRKIPLPPSVSGHRPLSAAGQDSAPADEEPAESSLTEKTGVVSVNYCTREGTAKDGHDFSHTEGVVIFNEDEYVKTIRIPIIDDYEYEADKEFFIDLSCPEESGIIGDPGVAKVTIIDDDVPGEFDFASTYFHGDPSSAVLRLVIDRMGGSDGTVTLDVCTEDGSAVGGDNCKSFDYVACNEQATFKHGEMQKTVEIRINEASAASKQFTAILKNPSFGAKLGAVSGAVCFIGPDESKHDEAKLAKEAQDDEEEELTYKGQFIQAMSIDAGEDEDGNPNEISGLDLLLHFCTFFFKVLIALVPPTQYLKAYPAFVISLIIIGTMTAFVEQLGNLLGCVLGIHQAVTGITIVAIGTSLPDTFASRTAALQDEYADNSVGNVTGSNSVNVFLGLGLPWCIATIYAAAKGKSYCVDPDNLFQSLVFFLTVATVCIIALFVRRALGGELGGPKAVKWVCGVCMIGLWVLYVILASLKAYNILQFNVDLPVASGVCSTAESSV
ncbi:hypothetical protein BOX15_Mlig025911g1 [Macrostomum lignano]|uniref:Calx-beta domain-containing protein n=1 Tax=Macrostomum lignano TaxID=282301 RepID=A0A267H614_9PLAT|nr:hypothetical protein BOX15_Mlig025911g1 [Macrostomum lignano]